MLFAVVPDERLHYRVFAGFDSPVSQLCQFTRIPFSGQDGIDNRQPSGPSQITDHVM